MFKTIFRYEGIIFRKFKLDIPKIDVILHRCLYSNYTNWVLISNFRIAELVVIASNFRRISSLLFLPHTMASYNSR